MKTAKSTGKIWQTLCAISIACALMLSACSGTGATAKEGDTVKVLYVGTYDNGSVFDSSELHGGDPLEFTIGSGNMIAGFEQAVIGMNVNQTKDVHIPSDDAYGPYYEELVITFNRSDIEGGNLTEVGDTIILTNNYGQQREAMVINASGENIVVDANHPLAGIDLNFEITLVEIIPAE